VRVCGEALHKSETEAPEGRGFLFQPVAQPFYALPRGSKEGGKVMEMTGLRDLHRSMITMRIDMQQFRFKTGVAEFDCLFSVREAPFVLTLTARSRKPCFLIFDVLPGYRVNTYLGDKYAELKEALFVDGRSGNALIPSEFFGDLNRSIPGTAVGHAVPTAADIVRLRHDLEDRDRPYFDRWEQRGSGPTKRNKAKTLAALGSEALEFSIKVNKSSIWSATATGRDWGPRHNRASGA
jgi:hypothetical protein